MTRWSQFVALATGHLGGRHSLRDIVANLEAQASRLYHLGARPVTRSSFARVNEEQPAELYTTLFERLYARCLAHAPRHGFRFKNKLYSLDTSLIDLSLEVFPWAHYALAGKRPRDMGMKPLRLVGYTCPETAREYEFLTNIEHLSARTIADLYKARWQVELFFKWLKQNLKLKGFVGTSKNAVLTQIWVVLCLSLLLAYLKFVARLELSLQQIARLLRLNLFLRRDLLALLRNETPPPPSPPGQWALAL